MRRRARCGTALAALAAVLVPVALAAQQRPGLRLVGPDGRTVAVDLGQHRGYQALGVSALEPLGWAATRTGNGWDLRHGRGLSVRLFEESPFFAWDGRLFQMTAEPYDLGGELHVPVQLVLDFFPDRLPDVYAVEEEGRVLRVKDVAHWPATGAAPVPEGGDEEGDAAEGATERVVIIDPGHGGRDPGATGPGGTREKDVALAVGLALRRELERYPDLEVHMTRDSDVLVPIWQRGEWATRVRGERPGVFISLHANALPNQRSARGFETYFLSEARTEHEQRVAALENAPLAIEEGDVADPSDPDLGFILKELRNFDHAHWSALLAELIQGRVAPLHPGPNRGVKQAPLAVITNALMPAVLVETGFITNREEERLLAREGFQGEMARALADAVVDFFRRYPPGQGTDLEPTGQPGPG